jgi:hypothetical protein
MLVVAGGHPQVGVAQEEPEELEAAVMALGFPRLQMQLTDLQI